MSATAYGPEVRQAVKTLHLEGLSSREIRERLATGTAGLPYSVEPGERTIDGWRRQWKRDGIREGFRVRDGDEQTVEDAIYRRILGLYRQELNGVEDAMIAGKANVKAVSRLAKYQAIVDATRYQRQLRENAAKGSLTPEEGGYLGAASGEAKPGSMLARLAREERDRPIPGR